MIKAEERAHECFPDDDVASITSRFGFLLGYQQAEKDNALTWNDMMVIHKCIKDAMNSHLYEWSTEEGQQRIYQNVLDRFNKERNKKTI